MGKIKGHVSLSPAGQGAYAVIPAKAGIQAHSPALRHSGESRNPAIECNIAQAEFRSRFFSEKNDTIPMHHPVRQCELPFSVFRLLPE